MAKVSFSYRSDKPTAQIEVRLILGNGKNRSSFYTRTQLENEISKQFWKEYKEGINFKDTEKKNLKNELKNHLHKLESFIIDEVKTQTEISKDWLKIKVNEYYQPKEEEELPSTLVEYFKDYLNKRKNEIKKGSGSWKKWNVILAKLERFQAERITPILIKNVNDNFVNEWFEYCQRNHYSISTINNNVKGIKQVCLHARRKGIETHLELIGLKTSFKEEKKEKLPKIYLSFEELKAISSLNNLPEYLENAKDWLIISCYTGQRISDFMRFDTSMIRNAKEGNFIDITQEKTGKEVTIPILPEVEETLQKRKGVFPRKTSEQRYIDYIKEVCKRAEIDEPTNGRKTEVIKVNGKNVKRGIVGIYPKYELIASHVGRRSFATNFYGKVPTTYLKNITGHGTEAMLLKYIGKTSKDTASEALNLMLNINR